MKVVVTIIVLLISLAGNAQEKAILKIDFDMAEYNHGKLFVALYNTEESFLKETSTGTIVEVVNGRATAIFENLKYGTYAVSSFYDKNDNGKLDTNFLGIPKEPTAMSNNAKGKLGPPKFKDAKFNISSTKNSIKINF